MTIPLPLAESQGRIRIKDLSKKIKRLNTVNYMNYIYFFLFWGSRTYRKWISRRAWPIWWESNLPKIRFGGSQTYRANERMGANPTDKVARWESNLPGYAWLPCG